LLLADFNEQDGGAIDHTFEHRDDHHKEEDGEYTDFHGSRPLLLIRLQVSDDGAARRDAPSLLDFSLHFSDKLGL